MWAATVSARASPAALRSSQESILTMLNHNAPREVLVNCRKDVNDCESSSDPEKITVIAKVEWQEIRPASLPCRSSHFASITRDKWWEYARCNRERCSNQCFDYQSTDKEQEVGERMQTSGRKECCDFVQYHTGYVYM